MKTTLRGALRVCWTLALGLAIAGWAIGGFFGTSEVDVQGVLHEPFFPLIPISFLLLLVAIAMALCDLLAGFIARFRRKNQQ